ncbi:MAG TPA: hypothetical protein DCW90_04900 [Lachnospiraceae bacterium]|nr:hypothetical protein [Lachnospiraceae bacterium]
MIPANSKIQTKKLPWNELSEALTDASADGYTIDKVDQCLIDGKLYGCCIMHKPNIIEASTKYLDEQFLSVPSETNLRNILSNEGLTGVAHLCVKAILTQDSVVGANMLFHTGSNIEFSAPISGIDDKLNISYEIESGVLKLSSDNGNITTISIIGYVLE